MHGPSLPLCSYAAINPQRQVPTLEAREVATGKTIRLTQSLAIIEFLSMPLANRWGAMLSSMEHQPEEAVDRPDSPTGDEGSSPLPCPLTKDVDFIEGDVVEMGVDGYDVILLVSAAFTDRSEHTAFPP